MLAMLSRCTTAISSITSARAGCAMKRPARSPATRGWIRRFTSEKAVGRVMMTRARGEDRRERVVGIDVAAARAILELRDRVEDRRRRERLEVHVQSEGGGMAAGTVRLVWIGPSGRLRPRRMAHEASDERCMRFPIWRLVRV